MASGPSLTVALPYATAPLRFVRAALKSLVQQEFTGWKGVVVDDSPGGNFEVKALVSEFRDSRLRYVRNAGPHGIGHAWNACADQVNAELFCLLHDDDELDPVYLTTMLRLAEAHPDASVYFCGATIIDDTGASCFSLPDFVKRIIAPRAEPIILQGSGGIGRLAVGDFIMCPTMTYRTAKIATRRFSTEHSFVLDYRFVLEILAGGGSIVGTHRRAYRYRRHGGQWTRSVSISGHRFREEIELLRELEVLAAQRNWPTVRRLAKLRPLVRLNVAYEILRGVVERRSLDKEKLRYLVA